MKKLAAVAVSTAFAAGTIATVAQPADAYALKPTLCQILGANNNANPWAIKNTGQYPFQVFVKAPGVTPVGPVTIKVTQTSTRTLTPTLVGGSYAVRTPAVRGPITIKFSYPGRLGLNACSASFSTTII